MTDRPNIFKSEAMHAAAERAREANPNKDLILDLREEMGRISAQISTLMTEDEKYANLLAFVFGGDNEELAASFMSGRELTEHLSELIDYEVETPMSRAVLSEVYARLDPEAATREEP